MTREEGLNICIKALRLHEDGSKEFFTLMDLLKQALNEDVPVFDIELFQAGLMDVPDGMTNGDVVNAIFGSTYALFKYVEDTVDSLPTVRFSKTWWNAPYKREVEE